jgi:hypothetical protein
MKVVIAGTRTFSNPIFSTVISWAVKKSGFPVSTVVWGVCPSGIDQLAKAFARARKLPDLPFPADWKLYKKAAGPIRNGQMARACDAGIVIYDGRSPGSVDMLSKLESEKKPKFWVICDSRGNILNYKGYESGSLPNPLVDARKSNGKEERPAG